MVKMRIPIDRQLGALVLFSSLVGLAVIAIATWVTNYNFVLGIRASRLSLTASLKAGQLSSNLLLMYSAVRGVSTRLIIQSALNRYNQDGNNTDQNWSRTKEDFLAVFDTSQQQALLLQGRLYPLNNTGPTNGAPLFGVTSASIQGQIELPYSWPNGTPVYLGDDGLGYPPHLYPNLTYSTRQLNNTFKQTVAHFGGNTLTETGSLLLGPWQINATFSLASITLPVINNTSASDILGWVTTILDGRYITQIVNSLEGLDKTGVTMVIGPDNTTNRLPNNVLFNVNTKVNVDDISVRFVYPPTPRDGQERHASHKYGTPYRPFEISKFPAIKVGYTQKNESTNNNNQGSLITTRNEEGITVSVGYAVVNSVLCDWLVMVEQAHSEVWEPIDHLRKILLACVFGTLGGMILLAAPVAYFSSEPIRRLRDATRKSVYPPGYDPDEGSDLNPEINDVDVELARKEGFFQHIKRWTRREKLTEADRREEARRRQFRIPGKVKDRKHFIVDELTDLTQTFNEMTDELMMQYEKLEERVQQRTAELELSKQAAESANESKTLFVANISHELKTPLNGILGMCAVCMSEDDPIKIKRSLGIIYKSGDLLLNLLTDLLTFSKNQVEQHLSLDEKDFRLRDISVQVLSIFDKQAKEGGIDLRAKFEGPADANMDENGVVSEKRENAPFALGRIRDMILWGDQHRILQVVINLVSNSLKFTPKGGRVVITIRCTGEAEDTSSRKNSLQSRQNSGRNSRNRIRIGSGSDSSVITPKLDTANEINAYEKSAYSHVYSSDRAPTPPPGRMLQFEFEVEDTGPGIPEHLQNKIFEPFVQADLGLSKKYGGTGLGLSICSQLATLMKGKLTLKSELGRGSTFLMQIPLRHLSNKADSTASSSQVNLPDMSRRTSRSSEEGWTNTRPGDDALSAHSGQSGTAAFDGEAKTRLVGLSTPFFASNSPLGSSSAQRTAAMDRVTEAGNNGEKIRVLVAEDNKTNQEVVLRMLKLEDIYDVTVATDGQEALDKVKESMENSCPYNLIFMDVQMPNLDGLQSTRLIRQSGFEAPIVALTAYAEEQNVKECLASGMNYFLSKPIRRPALKHVLKTYCPPIPEENEPTTTPPAEAEKQPEPKSQSNGESTSPT